MTPKIVDVYGRPLIPTDWLASCCGSSAVNKPRENTKFSNAGKGIRVFSGKYGREFDNGKTYLTHLETSAGPLTITIRYE